MSDEKQMLWNIMLRVGTVTASSEKQANEIAKEVLDQHVVEGRIDKRLYNSSYPFVSLAKDYK